MKVKYLTNCLKRLSCSTTLLLRTACWFNHCIAFGIPKFKSLNFLLWNIICHILVDWKSLNCCEYSKGWSYSLAPIQKVITVKCTKLNQSEIFISKLVSRSREEKKDRNIYLFFDLNFAPKLVLLPNFSQICLFNCDNIFYFMWGKVIQKFYNSHYNFTKLRV